MSGLTRIAQAFQAGRPAFMPYIPLGYPTVAASLDLVRTVVAAGADLVELGVPFSDPLADGPVIQLATQQALANGVTVAGCLDMVRQLRAAGLTTPFLLMGYVNPFMAYGFDRLGAAAVAAGVDGFIVPDLPVEEAEEFEAMCRPAGLAFIHFLAPTSPPARLAKVAGRAQGFIYLVSLTGVTGARQELAAGLPAFIQRVRQHTTTPLAVGFGIGNGDQARQVAQYADGVIVGSALVKQAGISPAAVQALAEEIVQAIRPAGGFDKG